MNHFTIRLISLLLLIGLIGGYQGKVKIMTQSADLKAMETALKEAEESLKENETMEEESSDTESVEESDTEGGFKDGTYQGEANGYGGIISVNVTIQDGVIASIDVISAEKEDSAYFSMATAVIDKIISTQSTEVDAISGATYSSTGIKNAVIAAVTKAAEE